MNNNGKIGVALVGGYLLGRTKKAKMALGLGLYLAGKKLNLNPQQLAKMVANSPVVGQLSDQVRKDLVGNTKSALTSAVTQRAGSLADSLHERTLDMNDPTRRARGSDDAEDEGAGDDRDESGGARAEDEGDEGDEREERRERPKARKAPAGSGKAAKTAKSTRSAASGSSGGRSASGGSRSGGARKTASSGARKTTGGARKTAAKSASGGARKAANRGGGNG